MSDLAEVQKANDWLFQSNEVLRDRVEAQAKRIAELVAMLDDKTGTPCEQLRLQERIAELEAALAASRKVLREIAASDGGRSGDLARQAIS